MFFGIKTHQNSALCVIRVHGKDLRRGIKKYLIPIEDIPKFSQNFVIILLADCITAKYFRRYLRVLIKFCSKCLWKTFQDGFRFIAQLFSDFCMQTIQVA